LAKTPLRLRSIKLDRLEKIERHPRVGIVVGSGLLAPSNVSPLYFGAANRDMKY
jgi:hypothetical protein